MALYTYKNKQWMKFVALSVVAHILVLFVVSQQSTSNKLKKTQSKELKPRIIQAQLIYQKAAVKPQKPQKKVKKTQKTKASVNEKTVVTEEASVKKAEPSKAKTKMAKPKKEDKSNQADLLKTTKSVKKIEPPKTIKPVTRSDIRAASKKYFSTIPEPPPFNPEFSNGSTSIMAINNKARPVPQHHKSIDNTGTMGAPKPTKVLCDNTIGVATAIMSGLTGGTVQCESLPDVSEFLKNRNKQKHNK